MMRKSFTLIELLIVIAIIAVLAVVVILTLNPAQLLKQARDSSRISDLDTLNHALALYQTDTVSSVPSSTSTVYVSLVDTTSTCANLGLPSLPTNWKYNCATSTTNLRNIDGTGWIPVNFKNISSGTPLSLLPIDPTNSTSSYYSFIVGQGYQINAVAESDKYASAEIQTSGDARLSSGTNLNLAPFASGLVGWWKFDETGTTALDSSGYGNSGTMYLSTSTIGDLHTSTGCKSGSCATFNGLSNFVRVLDSAALNPSSSNYSMNLWFYAANAGILYNKENLYETDASGEYAWQPAWAWRGLGDFGSVYGQWRMMTVVYDHAQQYFYRNGTLVYSTPQTGDMGSNTSNLTFAARSDGGSAYYAGLLDDIRIYNRALSAAEVAALYNATK